MKELTEIEKKIIEQVCKEAHETKDFKSTDFQRLINTYGRDLVFAEYKRLKHTWNGGFYCDLCEDTGLVIVYEKVSKNQSTFACGECQKAEWKGFKKIPKFHFRMKEFYYLEREVDVFREPLK